MAGTQRRSYVDAIRCGRREKLIGAAVTALSTESQYRLSARFVCGYISTFPRKCGSNVRQITDVRNVVSRSDSAEERIDINDRRVRSMIGQTPT
jgi:hypothetical protein